LSGGEFSVAAGVFADAHVVTDGHAGYRATSLGSRPHERKVQTKAERRDADALQGCHWTASLLKRWLLGTHADAVKPKHLQAYLDEFAFRHNRRKTSGVTRIAARVIEKLVVRPPLTMRQLIDNNDAGTLEIFATAEIAGVGEAHAPVCLGRHQDELLVRAALSPDQRLVHLHERAERLAVRTDHRGARLVQPRPRRLVEFIHPRSSP
jgi:hypothetical protein